MTAKEQKRYRIYETLPGITIWIIFLGSIILSFIRPIWVIYFIIIFDLYWLTRVLYLSILLLYSWRKFRKTIKIKWFEKLKKDFPQWQEYYHLIFLATYKEGIEVLRPSFKHLCQGDYPKNKFIVVLAGEGRDKENFLKVAEQIKKEFGDQFFKFLITVHPKDLKNEIPGKGSNLHYSGKQAKQSIDQLNIPYEKVIVSSFDVDTCAHPCYFSYLTHRYLSQPDPTRCSYQPIAIFNNNIWESPALTRIVARSTTFWLLTEIARPSSYFTFSSHSLSFKALVDINFWDKTVVSEDSRLFIQCYNRYNGNYKTVPLHIPVSMDTVYAGSVKRTLINQYKQILRWGYGVENVPWMIHYFSKNKKMPWWKGIRPLWAQFEGSCTWATVPILIFVLGNLPIQMANFLSQPEAIVQNAPFALERLMSVAMIGMVLSAILSTILLPVKPKEHKKSKYIVMVLQWVLFPITMIGFGSIPAADGITRLMLGKYLGFRVTEKARKKD